jgi:carbonic anhydrase
MPRPGRQPADLTRRALLRGGLCWGAGLGWAAAADAADLQARLAVCRPAGDPLEALLAGNRRFAQVWQSTAAERRPDLSPMARMERFADLWRSNCQPDPGALAKGQRPWAAVLACADSRVAPEWLFDLGPGELFDVRSAGNTAFDAGIASLEYAVAELAVPLIVVLGHSGCGAVTAALSRAPLTPLLEELVAPIRASLADSNQAGAPGQPDLTNTDLTNAVQIHTRRAAATLGGRSALLADAQRGGALRITPAFLDLNTGLVQVL